MQLNLCVLFDIDEIGKALKLAYLNDLSTLTEGTFRFEFSEDSNHVLAVFVPKHEEDKMPAPEFATLDPAVGHLGSLQSNLSDDSDVPF